MIAVVDTHEFYERKINTSEDVEKVKSMDPTFLSKVLQSIKEKLEVVSRTTTILDAKSKQLTKRIKLELPVLFSKTNTLEATIGNQVKHETTE
jgi:membrane protease subunit (stomatin/prohibitin family)